MRWYLFEETGPFGPVTVTGQRYECFFAQPRHFKSSTPWLCGWDNFYARWYIANPVKQLLKGHFGNARVVSRHFHSAWLPQSPDPNLCDF
ncbi:hypothetical protein TNCV_1600261 [Trichonephila clavipes]|nr:hypothetical protein TNCV_1600261 [Trichonephila clavipes]